jgi:hypothetical protein
LYLIIKLFRSQSSGFWWIPVSFWWIPVPFQWIPADSGHSYRNLWGSENYWDFAQMQMLNRYNRHTGGLELEAADVLTQGLSWSTATYSKKSKAIIRAENIHNFKWKDSEPAHETLLSFISFSL